MEDRTPDDTLLIMASFQFVLRISLPLLELQAVVGTDSIIEWRFKGSPEIVFSRRRGWKILPRIRSKSHL